MTDPVSLSATAITMIDIWMILNYSKD